MLRDPSSNRGDRILILGADRVMPKLFYFGPSLGRLGLRYAIYTHDTSDEARQYAAQSGVELIPGPPHRRSVVRMLRDCARLVRVVARGNIRHVELYSDFHILASFAYFSIVRLCGFPVVLWCRGELFSWSDFAWWQRAYFHWVVPRCRGVILKEAYMRATLERAGVRIGSGVLELHNTVPLPAMVPRAFDGPVLRLLFLNMFKTWRNTTFCVEVAHRLRRAGVRFVMKLVGDKTESPGLVEEGQKVRAAISKFALEDVVSVHPFASDPEPYYRDADLFLLPADLIFCNYALLEAMSHGVVPVVNSHDRDYARIIEHEVSGFGLPLDASQWADLLAALTSDRARLQRLSASARRRIESGFSVDSAFERYRAAAGLPSTPAM